MAVYFLPFADKVKIGYTDAVTDRLRQLQTAHPDILEFELIVNGGQWLEKLLHAQFDHYRYRGEWFVRTDEIDTFIKDAKRNGAINISSNVFNPDSADDDIFVSAGSLPLTIADLSNEQLQAILDGKTKDVAAQYNVSDRTVRNWKKAIRAI